ncbi:MAG TPA: hypothetical protein VMU72_08955 [Gaiellaceae bacterium]|nr:hypothetical protein [Gaiellaceae bacterium]
MTRFMWWIGDILARLHRRYGAAYSAGVFVLGWLVLSVGAHFGGLDGSPMRPQSWSSAVVWGFVFTCILLLMVRLFNSWR